MAEAVVLFGVTAAGIQCVQVGVQILILGLSLRSKLKDAPEQIKRWFSQIEQLVALAELIKKVDDVDLLTSTLQMLPSPSVSPARTSTAWIEAALLECSDQAQTLKGVLEDMMQEVDDGKGKKIWRSILTVKRETRITTALQEIERHKSLLIMWLGQNNLRQLNGLHHIVTQVRDGVGKVDGDILQVEQTFRQQFQSLSTALHDNSRATASEFEVLRNLSMSGVESLKLQMQQQHGELQSEGSAMHLQLHSMMQEMKAIKHEFQKLAPFASRISRTPSLLKDALKERSEAQTWCLNASSNPRQRNLKGHHSTVPQICTCRATNQFGLWRFGFSAQVGLNLRSMHVEDCPTHSSMKGQSATVHCYAQGAILENLVKLSFEATCGAGGRSIGFMIRTSRIIQTHPLESFFRDLYCRGTCLRNYSRPSSKHKTLDALFRLAKRELQRTFNTGVASPDDVDCRGRTLIHLQIECASHSSHINHVQLSTKVIGLLISIGVKIDYHDHFGRTSLENILRLRNSISQMTSVTLIDSNIFDWNTSALNFIRNGGPMFDCMRTWPESREELGYAYICDILLRKSKEDLESFICRGMKPAEKTYRRLTPLHLAAAADWPEGVELLLTNGADRNAQDSELCLPIDFAIERGCQETVKLLLDGDCTLQFTTPRKHMIYSFPRVIRHSINSTDCGNIRDMLLDALISLKHYLEVLCPYHVFARCIYDEGCCISAAERIFSGGVVDLEIRDESGRTALMTVCLYSTLEYAKWLLERGANVSSPHRDSALTAGFFLAASDVTYTVKTVDLQLYTKLLQSAFDIADTVESYCLCCPGGFTPISVLNRFGTAGKRRSFKTFMLCLQWPLYALEQQARAFAWGEVFNRLQMTHTCVNIHKPGKQISEEDRREIESEEEEFIISLSK